MRHIQAISFDCWHTLIYDAPDDDSLRAARRVQRVRQVLRKRNFTIPESILETAHDQVWERLGTIWATNVDVTLREQVRMFIAGCGAAGKADFSEETWTELEAAYVEPFDEIPPYVVDDARPILDRLHQAGYRIALLCNTGRTPGSALRRFFAKHDLLPYFEATFFSDEMLERKPAPGCFLRTFDALRTRPEHTVHVGDDAHMDVFGARQAGCWSIQFRGSEFRRRRRRRSGGSHVMKNIFGLAPRRHDGEKAEPDLVAHRLTEIPAFLDRLEEMWPLRYGSTRARPV